MGLRLGHPKPIEVKTGSRYDYGDYGDGYDWMETAREKLGYTTLSSWGLDGWDLGDWPYIVIQISADRKTVLDYCEGDLTFSTFETVEDASAFIDFLFLFHNGIVEEELRKLPGPMPLNVDDLPERFRGSFSWHRSNQSRGEACPETCKACAREKETAEA